MTELTSFSENAVSRQFRGPYARKILIADIPNIVNGAFTDISQFVTQASVNYTMDTASELSFDIVDPSLKMAEANYFTLTRDVIYETQTLGRIQPYDPSVVFVRQLFEMANISTSQGPGGSPTFSIKCYSKAVQQMKRDRKIASSIKGTGTQFIRNAAKKFGLECYAQETTKSQKIKATGSKQAESLWNIMKSLAGEAKFVLFEVDGFLLFGSEEWLMHKWGSNSMQVPKYKIVAGKTTKKIIGYEDVPKKPIYSTSTSPSTKVPNGTKTVRFISLQFPNSSNTYLGKPGILKLTEYPSISKSENDPRDASGSCTVERINGTQIRPGMTAYVGDIPNMSGYFLVESVTYNEMSPDPVSVSFRTQKRDEEKYKIKDLPIGVKYVQTNAVGLLDFSTVQTAVKNRFGQSKSKPPLDARVFPLPDSGNPYRYPSMVYANLTTAYPAFKDEITGSKPKSDSTGDKDSIIYHGTYNLYDRPVLVISGYPQTTYPVTITEIYGSEYRAILLPSIFTQNNVAVLKQEDEIKAQYLAAGGYEGAGKHLGVARGITKQDAINNARDYAKLIFWQQSLILANRFPDFVGNEQNIPNTPGAADSVWI